MLESNESSVVDGYKLILRKLVLRDDRYIESLLAEERASAAVSGLDERSRTLVRLGALIAMNAATPSYMSAVDKALDVHLSYDEIVGTLIAALPVVGAARVVSSAPNLALALGYDVSEALETVENGDYV